MDKGNLTLTLVYNQTVICTGPRINMHTYYPIAFEVNTTGNLSRYGGESSRYSTSPTDHFPLLASLDSTSLPPVYILHLLSSHLAEGTSFLKFV
jgi:hypothetical protein